MEKKSAMLVAVLVVMMIMSDGVKGAGECGRAPINQVATGLSPCIGAAKNGRAPVPAACCAQVKKLMSRPACLCAVFMSPIAKSAKINPAVAISIPKRCNIRNRPAGKRCGRYVVP